jgi:hypothetical protein
LPCGKISKPFSTVCPRNRRARALQPYAELLDELRGRNWTYRGIAQVLAEKCNLKISPSNIHHFVKLRQGQTENPEQANTATKHLRIEPNAHFADQNMPKHPTGLKKQQDDGIRQRVNALKRRSSGIDQEPKAFEFDPSEPLRLNKQR